MALRLLCVCAHPDDECFAFGGALALAANRGVETSVVCLTDGQAATHRGTSSSGKELGAMRRQEFEASCKVLGVKNFELLTYQDAQLEFESLSSLGAELVKRIRQLRPHVIITFGGEGALNTHADHTTVSAATTAAFHWAGHAKRYPDAGPLFQPQRLYYVTSSFVLPERHIPLLAPWTCTLDIKDVFERKQEAFRQHVSQAPVMHSTADAFARYGQSEHYTLAAATVPQPARQSTDLFEGVADV
ncbi:PIG-L deacetylase family protein [Granulicella cerasi]|uniref:PIG-L deacetylase family protein n=1 Tax=Granulicella cerasi TaxID=741063 RepID=A0ABW1ZBT7_9BACT|nr:PIG-L family deacetylase [Granulicella cerasi]